MEGAAYLWKVRTPGLLAGFGCDLLPTGEALGRGLGESAIGAGGFPGMDSGYTELSGLFDEPFEAIEFEKGRKKGQVDGWRRVGQLFDHAKSDQRLAGEFDFGQINVAVVREFVGLAWFDAKNSDEMFSVGTRELGGATSYLRNEETTPGHEGSVWNGLGLQAEVFSLAMRMMQSRVC